MFILHNRNTSADGCDDDAALAVTTARKALADSASGLEFEPAPHQYTFYGKKLQCVSEIVEEYAPFDSRGAALGTSKNPKSELYGMPVEDILHIWANNRDASAIIGTLTHEFAEACFLYCSGRSVQIEETLSDRILEDGFEARNPKEEAAAKWWDSLDLHRYILVAKEAYLVNPVLRYAGTLDLLLYDTLTGTFVLKDYKTNSDLMKKSRDKMKAPLTPIMADNIGKYTLQQNLYKIQLENIGIPVSSMSLIWLKDEGEYEEVELRDCSALVKFAMNQRIKQNKI